MDKTLWVALCCLAFVGGVSSGAGAQTTPEPAGDEPVLRTPHVTVKPWRFFWEDVFSTGVSVDLNPRSKFLIFYPHVSTIVFVGPEFGINLRTTGVSYGAVGIASNVWIAEPLVRVSYGQQIHNSFVEIGIVAFPGVGANASGQWVGPRVIPRLVLGTRL